MFDENQSKFTVFTALSSESSEHNID